MTVQDVLQRLVDDIKARESGTLGSLLMDRRPNATFNKEGLRITWADGNSRVEMTVVYLPGENEFVVKVKDMETNFDRKMQDTTKSLLERILAQWDEGPEV